MELMIILSGAAAYIVLSAAVSGLLLRLGYRNASQNVWLWPVAAVLGLGIGFLMLIDWVWDTCAGTDNF